MYNTSDEYNNRIYESGRKFHINVEITPASGSQNTLKLTEKEIMEGGLTIEDSVSAPNKFEIGATVINKLTIVLYDNSGNYSNFEFDGAKIYVQVGLEIGENDDKTPKIEYIPKGYFYVDEATFVRNTVTITAFDCMHDFDKPYSISDLTYPATLMTILKDACHRCNVSFGAAEFMNSNYMVDSRPTDEKTTFREVVSWVAQLAGSFAKISNDGALILSWYDYSKITETGHMYAKINKLQSCEVATGDIKVTGLKIVPNDKDLSTIFSGAEGYVVVIQNNPLVQANAGNLCTSIWKKLKDFTFRPFSAKALSNPAIEAGDVCILTDQNGNEHQSFISTLSYTYGEFESFRADAETVNKKSTTRFSVAAKIEQKVADEVAEQISQYDLASEQLGNLVINAMGLFESKEIQSDGSVVYYAHDKPTRAESQIIWAKARNAFAVSNDGGKTWHGINDEGNIVGHVLSVVGVSASWIDTGTLRVGLNEESAGDIDVYGNGSELICRINQDGITFWSNDKIEGDRQKICLNANDGLVGYDGNNTRIFWADKDDFHMKDSHVENELTLCGRLKFLPVSTTDRYGIAIVACGEQN